MLKSSYKGLCKISFLILSPTSSLKIHSEDPVIIKKILKLPTKEELMFNSTPFSLTEIILNETTEGNLQLEIEFECTIGYNSKGCFISSNNTLQVLSTHFEPIYARNAFPCLDEPKYKAEYLISIRVDGDWNVISNMPIDNIDENTKIVKFVKTPKMSTYLVHWTICKHEVSTYRHGEILISLYSPIAGTAREYLPIVRKMIEFYEEQFEYKYMLPKLDLISINSNFYTDMQTQAMENWGAITYLASSLEKSDMHTFQGKYRNLRILAHEISHMWFGNLVTLDWWDEVWLNEGFARFLEFACLDKIKPEFHMKKRFVTDVHCAILNFDCPVSATHSLKLPGFLTPWRLGSYFDGISYFKGASILRMLQCLIGKKQFLKALQFYLSTFAYKTVTGHDFFQTLSSFTSYPIESIMEKWLNQSSYPLVIVKNLEPGKFHITQRGYDRYCQDIWHIPIKYLTQAGEIKTYILSEKQGILEESGDWIKLNYKTTGYYRVIYDNYQPLLKIIHKLKFSDRYGLLNDSISHYNSGLVPFTHILQLTQSLIPEYDYLIINPLLSFLRLYLQNPKISALLSTLIGQLLKPIWEKYAFSVLDAKNYDVYALREIAYVYYTEYCRDNFIAVELNQLDCPEEICAKFFYYCVSKGKIKEDIFDLACVNVKFAIYVLENSCDVELLRFVLRFYRFSLEFDSFGYEVVDFMNGRRSFYNADELLKAIFMEHIEYMKDHQYTQLLHKYASILSQYGNFEEHTLNALNEDYPSALISSTISFYPFISCCQKRVRILDNSEKLLQEILTFTRINFL
ncbi:hypothetical protein SteCoe_32793 [Stentor coeruleus]|uniref:Aminopeptidase n=1 Tax=Stentor coeruleus TaxID=5963 RepID=A0A1R2AY78_9CILI|nr:hypothetical protein SteCoe_32793 [Stentor coeruleus]